MEHFLCNKCKIALKPKMQQNPAVSKALLENVKITDHKYLFWILKIIAFLEDRLHGQAITQPSSNFKPRKLLMIKETFRALVAYKKLSVVVEVPVWACLLVFSLQKE